PSTELPPERCHFLAPQSSSGNFAARRGRRQLDRLLLACREPPGWPYAFIESDLVHTIGLSARQALLAFGGGRSVDAIPREPGGIVTPSSVAVPSLVVSAFCVNAAFNVSSLVNKSAGTLWRALVMRKVWYVHDYIPPGVLKRRPTVFCTLGDRLVRLAVDPPRRPMQHAVALRQAKRKS